VKVVVPVDVGARLARDVSRVGHGDGPEVRGVELGVDLGGTAGRLGAGLAAKDRDVVEGHKYLLDGYSEPFRVVGGGGTLSVDTSDSASGRRRRLRSGDRRRRRRLRCGGKRL